MIAVQMLISIYIICKTRIKSSKREREVYVASEAVHLEERRTVAVPV
jgi:hypothetical protein